MRNEFTSDPDVPRHICWLTPSFNLPLSSISVNFLTDPLEGRSTLRPADILVFGWVGGKHACVDPTGVSPLVGLGSSAFTVGRAALKAASGLDNRHLFIPFAFNTFGFWRQRLWTYLVEFYGRSFQKGLVLLFKKR
ncbi:hypothetical protein HanPSC8_Chr04g0179671 [Helianthus annuus]|nr:hypothetical protein HanPSC8_Chr04g0179671 [Helianthus annuus]